jgi:recombination protein RecA
MVKKVLEEKPLSQAEKKKRLKQKMALINKKAGKQVISMATEATSRDRIPFTSEELNEVTGGGIPRGAFSVLWGSKAAGKTSACYDLISHAQQRGLMCELFDFERSFDPEWAKTFGVDPEYLALANFENAEEGMDNVIDVCKAGLVDLIVIDSIQGMCPKGEFETKAGKEKSLEDDTMALLPRRLSKFFPKAAPFVNGSNCAVVLIGQTRMDLGSFVVLEQLSGGRALEHWSSLTVNCRRGQKAKAPTKKVLNENTGKNETVPIGFEMVAKVNKSKVGADEGREARLPFYFGSGFVKLEEESEESTEDNN